MKVVYADTETSGLKPGQIGQLSMIIDNGNQLVGKNYFFTVDYVDPGAAKVTGMDAEKYRQASNGLVFADWKDEIHQYLEGSLLVCHNVKFDQGFIDVEFWRVNTEPGYVDTFCTMEYFTNICQIPRKDRYGYRQSGGGFKSPKLAEVGEFLNIDNGKVRAWANQIFGSDDEVTFHDARFDTALMTVCMRAYTEMVSGDASKGWYNTFVRR